MTARFYILVLLTITSVCTHAQWVSDGSFITREEYKLYTIVNQYRNSRGLHTIPLSRSLTAVAQTHVRDLMEHFTQGGAGNAHSWSSYGSWTACCYTPDHAQAQHMWNKPSQLTPYKGDGFEIAYGNLGTFTAEDALKGWKSSPGHHSVIINTGIWADARWSAIGIAIYKNYSVIWFGKDTDPVSGQPQIVEDETDVYDRKSTRLQSFINNNKQSSSSTSTPSYIYNSSSSSNYSSSKYNSELRHSSSSGNTFSKKHKERVKGDTPRERFYSYAGEKHTSFVSVGYSYSIKKEVQLVNASLLDFRYKMFGASLINAEMGIDPWSKWIGYSPSIKVFFPVTCWLALSVNAGATADASIMKTSVKEGFDYDMRDDFFASACGGISLYIVPVKYVPIELKIEYRHDIYNESPIEGLVVGGVLHLGR